MAYVQDRWVEQILGKRCDLFIPYYLVSKYHQIYWSYFLIKVGDEVVLSHLVNNQRVVVGTYKDVEDNASEKVIALRLDGYYDIFEPNIELVIGKEGDVFETSKGVFVWIDEKKKWVFHPNCRLWGKNAVYRCFQGANDEKIGLYRIDGEQLSLEAMAHKWSWMFSPEGLNLNGMIYLIDETTGMVNFENPKFTFMKKVKNFFKLKS